MAGQSWSWHGLNHIKQPTHGLGLTSILLYKKYQNVLRICWFYAKISLILDTAAGKSTTKQILLSNYAFTQGAFHSQLHRG